MSRVRVQSGPPSLGWSMLRRVLAKRTEVEVAKLTGSSKQTISALANHKVHMPTVPIATSLEEHFGIPTRAWTVDWRTSADAVIDRLREIVDELAESNRRDAGPVTDSEDDADRVA